MPCGWPRTRSTRRSSRIGRARPRIRRSRILPSAPPRDKSKRDPPAAAIAWPNTTSCSALKKSSARAPDMREGPRSVDKVVLLRHGESTWNKENRFTGWTDVDLSERGRAEAQEAGRLLREGGYQFDIAFTSVLTRAIRMLGIALDVLGQLWIPVKKNW